jgi:hypothetical protein
MSAASETPSFNRDDMTRYVTRYVTLTWQDRKPKMHTP